MNWVKVIYHFLLPLILNGCCSSDAIGKGKFREGMKKNSKLVAYAKKHGHGNWRTVPAKALLRNK